MLRLLLGLRLRIAWNRIARAPRPALRTLGLLLALVFGLGFVGVAGLNASLLVDRLARIDTTATQAILPAVLVAAIVLALVTSLGMAFHHLFMAADAELLLATPVPRRDLFVLMLLETWRDCIHVVLFLLAALIGFGFALRLSLTYYVVAVVLAVGLTFVATTAGTTLTLLLARVRFGASLMGLARLIAVLLFLPAGILGVPALGLSRGRALPDIGQDNLQTLASTLRDIGPPPAWAPTTWATQVLLGDSNALVSAVLLLALATGVLLLALATWERAFQPAWERVRFSGPRAAGTVRVRWSSAGPLASMLHKDFRTLVRDPRWRTSLLVGVAALGVPMLLFSAGSDPGARLSPEARFWIGLFPVPYLAYVAGSQHGAATLAYEGRNLALLRASPIGFARLLLAKLAGSLVLVLGITWLATIVLALRHGATTLELLSALAIAAWLATGGTAAGLIGAALTADFETDNPQRRVGCLGTVVTSGLSAIFFATNTGLLIWVLMRMLGGIPRPLIGLAPVVDWLVTASAVFALGALVLAGQLGMRRLAHWEAS